MFLSTTKNFFPQPCFALATGSPEYKGLLREKNSSTIAVKHQYAIYSPQYNQWEDAMDKEMKRLCDHEFYDLVPLTSVPRNKKIIGFRVVFEHGALKARLAVQCHSQEPGIYCGILFA